MTNFKKAPKAAVQALQLRAAALNEMTAGIVMDAMRLDPETGKASPSGLAGRGPTCGEGSGQARRQENSVPLPSEFGLTPPSSNTGGKGRKTPKKSIGD